MNETLEIINKYNIKAKKRLSQNFLADEHVIHKIAESAEPSEKMAVIEIGSGLGSLTKELIKRSGSVIAIELDSYLCEILRNEYGCEKLTILNEDILKTDITALAAEERKKALEVSVCANLPYHLTSPVIIKLLKETKGLSRLTLMVQKEVADRLLARPGTKEYGSLTTLVNYYSDVSLVANVPPNCFVPRPGVYSAVVRFEILGERRVAPLDEELMFLVIRAAFGQRRKTLYNALSNQLLPKIGVSRQELLVCIESLSEAGITPTVRGETLGLEEFALISNKIYRIKNALPGLINSEINNIS